MTKCFRAVFGESRGGEEEQGGVLLLPVSQVERDGAKLAKIAVLVVNGRGPTIFMAEEPAGTLLAALYEKAIPFTYIPTPGDHMSDLRIKLSAALEFLHPHISAPVGAK